MRLSQLELNLNPNLISCTTDEIEATLAAYLREMRSVARLLRADERVALRKIMSNESGTLTVADVFRGFSRDSEAHKTLRRLRAAQFIRPAKTGRWDADEPIEIRPFGQLMWDKVGENEICGPSREVHVARPAAPADEEPIDLGGPVAWDDADVLDDLVRHADEATRETAEGSHFA